MAPTTEYRGFYDLIGDDPLRHGDAGAAIGRAALATEGSSAATWISTLRQALAATASLLDGASVERHPLGFALGPANETCGSCAWLYVGGRGRPVERCRQKNAAAKSDSAGRTSRDFAACEKWEPPVDCQTCGACCREAYHVVSVSMRDPVVWKQPELIVRRGYRFEILRNNERCAALNVDTPPAGDAATADDSRPRPSSRYHCRIYEDRPSTCREFAAGGNHCLSARQRVGISR
ncbi:MAG TPA: YkgJ family cysteine cluster protein [Polyangia bacterium]|nr:YkgJ family cysteine cluster protein [Polyangia bacterium]